MVKYRKEENNTKLRNAVRKCGDYTKTHTSCHRKYLSNEEYSLDIAHFCGITLGMAKKVCWIERSDDHNEDAMRIFGFDKYTA